MPQQGAIHRRRAEQELGHRVLATAPQITRAIRRAKGAWAQLASR